MKIDVNLFNNVLHYLLKNLKIIYYLLIFVIILILFKYLKLYRIIITIIKILSPFFIGLIISYLLNPCIKLLSKKISNKISVIIVYSIIFLLIILSLLYILPTLKKDVIEFIKTMPYYINEIETFTNNILYKLNIDYRLSIDLENIKINNYNTIFNIIKDIVSYFSIFLLGIIISFYLSFNFEYNIKKYINYLPVKNKRNIIELIKEININVFSFVKGTFIIFIIIFLVSTISFKIAGLSSSIFFALFNALTNTIPYIGPYIGASIIILKAFTQSKSLGIKILIILLIIQIVESYIIHPIIMSKNCSLHPVIILISLLLFGYFFGIIGMVLAIPIILIARTIILYIYKNNNK